MALGALLEFMALWRIGSKLEQMDRRQAAMNEAYLAEDWQDEPELDEPRFFDGIYNDSQVVAEPERTEPEWAEMTKYYDRLHEQLKLHEHRAPATAAETGPPLLVAPPHPQIAPQKLTWWRRLGRWFAN